MPMTAANAADAFSFFVSTDLRFGAGEAVRLPEFLAARGWHRVGLVVDAGIAGTPAWREVEQALVGVVTLVARLENAAAEPTYDFLDEARRAFMGTPLDVLVVAGGGSTLDLGKAISVLITNPRPAVEYRGSDKIEIPGCPVVALPTTAGTGSEVTPNAVFTHAAEKRKLGINTRLYVPRLVVLDPLLTVSCPPAPTRAAGLDALVQAIENYASTKATPASRVFSRQAVAMAFEALPAVMRNPSDVDARGAMQLAAFFSGIGLMNGGGGIAGALSYPLGTFFDIPHGLAHAVFTPAVVRWNVERGSDVYAGLYAALSGSQGMPPAWQAGEFERRLRALFTQVGGPLTLEALGLDTAAVGRFKEVVAGQTLLPAFGQNPVPFDISDVPALVDTLARPGTTHTTPRSA